MSRSDLREDRSERSGSAGERTDTPRGTDTPLAASSLVINELVLIETLVRPDVFVEGQQDEQFLLEIKRILKEKMIILKYLYLNSIKIN